MSGPILHPILYIVFHYDFPFVRFTLKFFLSASRLLGTHLQMLLAVNLCGITYVFSWTFWDKSIDLDLHFVIVSCFICVSVCFT